MSTNSTIGTHSSSRVVGRSVTSPLPLPLPGDGDASVVPRASMAATEPGAIDDSPTSNRSTAKRTGAKGSSGGTEPLGRGVADGAPLGVPVADGAALGAPDDGTGVAAGVSS